MSTRLRLRPAQRADIARGAFTRVDLPLASLLVGKVGGAWRAYANVCPHRLVPLDFGGSPPMSHDGRYLLCNQHGALFRPEDGACIEGPCAGDSLTKVGIWGDGEDVVADDVPNP